MFDEQPEDESGPMDHLSHAAYTAACLGVAFAAFVYGLDTLGVI